MTEETGIVTCVVSRKFHPRHFGWASPVLLLFFSLQTDRPSFQEVQPCLRPTGPHKVHKRPLTLLDPSKAALRSSRVWIQCAGETPVGRRWALLPHSKSWRAAWSQSRVVIAFSLHWETSLLFQHSQRQDRDALSIKQKETKARGPGWVSQLVRASSRYTKVAGSIPSRGTCKNQPVDARISGTTNGWVPPPSLPLSDQQMEL